MVRTKHESPTDFAYPVERICGKISRHSRVVHSCTASGKRITYLQGQRNLNTHPIRPGEVRAMNLFGRRQAVANARLKKTAETYAADQAAYLAQVNNPGGIEGFQKYIWSLVKAEIAE